MSCCDYDCHQGRDCPARATPTDEALMSHTTFTTHGHTVAVTGPQASALAKRIRCAEQAHQARMQDVEKMNDILYSLQLQEKQGKGPHPQITGKPSCTRRALRFLRNPWTIALVLTAATWVASMLLVSKVAGA
jgi:hypothetical protein